ncbi:MAG: trypsin-like peptidase domain-containing protein [Planctomycetota bacterium]|nr:trypsin-like peptidase domain-containing protein [Planctomycetota bacterium]
MTLLAAMICCSMQDPAAAVAAAEARRVAVIERCSRAVCSVMSMDAPGGGSGVIFDPAGLVLTNYHVVGEPDKDYRPPEPPEPPASVLADLRAGYDPETADAGKQWNEAVAIQQWQERWRREHLPAGKAHYKNKKIGLPDGRLYEGVVLGIDPGSDLAVIRMLPKESGQTWPYCDLGDSDEVLVGETVFAMGNPFLLATDFKPTVTFGIVSGTHRYQEGQGGRMLVYPDCIQVDAPVNPGNSGGPLFNERGEVIGINGRISIGDRGRVNVGVGFAIASNQIRNFLGELVAGRHAEHGTLDMSAWFMTSREGEEKRRGVFVQQMFQDSVTAAAGVGLGDEITRFNGVDVRSANQLATMVGVLPAGTWVTLRHRPLLEDGGFGDEREVTVQLATLDTGSSRDGTGDDARLGSRVDRRIVTDQLVDAWAAQPAAAEEGPVVKWSRRGPTGDTFGFMAFGDRVVLDVAGVSYARLGDGDALAFVPGEDASGVVVEMTVDMREGMRRELAANPMLWRRSELRERLKGALLIGGVHVLGRPGYRFAIPGKGDCEAWFLLDGTPAGYAYRDPMRKAHVAYHVRGEQLRVVVDGALEPGWTAGAREFGEFDQQGGK